MEAVLDHFKELTSQGIKVIPLWANSKAPMLKGWSKNWNYSTVCRTLSVYPEANIGILLGDIIDVEGDSKHANKILEDVIGNYPHPTYSSSKSVHHLFVNPDPKFRLFKKEQIEFRGKGHQSVLPPSRHQGADYQWIHKTFPVPEMPERLLYFWERFKKNKKTSEILKKEHSKIWCSTCGKKCFLHTKRLELELKAFQFINQKWECRDCRTFDVRYLCRSIKSGKIY